jgi:hypothetical protein
MPTDLAYLNPCLIGQISIHIGSHTCVGKWIPMGTSCYISIFSIIYHLILQNNKILK